MRAIVTMLQPEFQSAHEPNIGAQNHDFTLIIGLRPNARVLMTRDMELIRRIILEIQSWKDVTPRKIKFDGVENDILMRHLEMLKQEGMIDALFHHATANAVPDLVYITDLTWSGHDFAESIKHDGVWDKIKSSFSAENMVSLPLSVIKDIGVGLLKEWAKKQVGLS
jgi:hypothetical protein